MLGDAYHEGIRYCIQTFKQRSIVQGYDEASEPGTEGVDVLIHRPWAWPRLVGRVGISSRGSFLILQSNLYRCV